MGEVSTSIAWTFKKSGYFKHMQENALYYPKYPNFPLVDFYHKDINDKLFGIQVTISSKHPKKIAVYESFYDQIRTTPEAMPLSLYFFILPQHVNS